MVIVVQEVADVPVDRVAWPKVRQQSGLTLRTVRLAAALLTGAVGLDGVADAFERLGNSPSEAKILIDPSR